MFKLAALSLLLLAFTALCQSGTEVDQKAIQGVVDSFTDAWNRHDAHAFAEAFADDADFTNWRGEGATGRSKIEQFHAPMFATIFRNSHESYSSIKIRFIRTEVAAVDVHWEMTGAFGCAGEFEASSSRSGESCDGESSWCTIWI